MRCCFGTWVWPAPSESGRWSCLIIIKGTCWIPSFSSLQQLLNQLDVVPLAQIEVMASVALRLGDEVSNGLRAFGFDDEGVADVGGILALW